MTTKHNLTFRSGKTRDRIVDYLAKHPGATSARIATALGHDNNATCAALNTMNKAGLVARWKVGVYYRYMLKADSNATLKKLPPVDPKNPEQYTLLMPVPPQPDVTELERRLAELEAFKAEAIAKHPDLTPVDYEAYREALNALYAGAEWGFECSDPLDNIDKKNVDAMIAAAKLFPA